MAPSVTSPEPSLPAPSSLTKLLQTFTPPSSHPAALHHLALQIQHNLQHQHSWTALCIHTHSPLTGAPLPRVLLSGLPPTRLYVHPDEQIELLKEAEKRKSSRARTSGDSEGNVRDPTLEVMPEPEREWVLPTRLSEKWTLRRLAEVFEGIGVVPPEVGEEDEVRRQQDGREYKWRKLKRVVLATVDQDSTVVYYIVHDGIVKPRQN